MTARKRTASLAPTRDGGIAHDGFPPAPEDVGVRQEEDAREACTGLAGRRCIVTGAASGIGRAAARALGRLGARVAVVDIDEAGGTRTIELLRDDGTPAVFVRADVSSAGEVRSCVDELAGRWGGIDVLVNNAAVMTFDPVSELSEDDWERVIAVNLRSVFLFSKYCLPHMRGGSIVNVGSVHAHRTTAGVAPYAASKAAIEAFTRALSRETPAAQARVNCVAPGGVDTPLFWRNPQVANIRREDLVYSTPEQIAAVIAFLAGGASDAINGATLVADRGVLATL